MKKFTLIILFIISVTIAITQTATLKIGTIENAQPGTVLVPITLEAINNPVIGSNLISSWGWYIAYDASVLNAGAPMTPATLLNYHPQFAQANYLTNIIADNPVPGWNTIAVIYYAEVSGTANPGDKFFDIQFTYVTGSTNLTWTTLGSFLTNMADYEGNEFTLTLINGNVSAPIGPTTTLNAKMFLEGPYFNSQMTPFLNILGYLPLDQPYNTEPWNYNGTETVTAIPNANVVDWVLVELLKRHQGNEEYIFEVMERKAAFLLKNGDIKDLDGTSGLAFNNFDEPEFYVRIYHRNHLPLISPAPLTGTNGIYNYDFTTGPAKAIGGASVQKQLKLDLWGAMTGDGNASKQIDNKDKNELWLIENNLTGYFRGDYNMDSQVDDDDKSIKWKSNAGRGLPAVTDSIPPPAPWACGDPIVDLRDSQSYNTVEIGTQCWMAENLNIGTRINGSGDQTDNAILEKYCYDNNEANCDTYGGLYQWNEMMQYATQQGTQGICPDGWHIPMDGEWCELEQFVDPTLTCNSIGWRGVDGGDKLKEAGTTHWNSPNGATNSSGFTALPGGDCTGGSFGSLRSNGNYWSSNENGTNGWHRSLRYIDAKVARDYNPKARGFSVRCIQGEYVNQPPSIPSSPQPSDGAVNQPTNSSLSWTCTDPDNDPLTYDVYFGTVNPPSLVSSGQTEITYIPGQLDESTSYFWKIVAHDNQGFTTEGPVWTFTTRAWQCADPLIDTRDMQTYPTVQIGTQCWMAENLNIGNMVQGNVNMTNNSIIEKYCYSNSTANCDVYGGLYQWNEMMQYVTLQGTQGICPAGWHLPKDAEWTTLTDYLGGASVAGGKLKETGNTHWLSPNGGATNESGFTALPGGYRYSGGIFLDKGNTGNWWTSTELAPDARYRSMTNLNGMVNSDVYYKSSGFSVRCVLGEYVNQPPSVPSNPQPVNGAIDQPINTTLSWTCTDIENDPLTFDVYFGNTNPPALVSSGQTTTGYNPGLLINSTTYYWKIVAHDNQTNSTEGTVWNFITIAWLCNQPFVDTRDGQTYSSVQIGDQCWMAENLNIGTRIDGIVEQTDNTILEKYCYDNLETNCDTYGGLYQWNEMMQYVTTEGVQGICPTGWHLPTDGEWTGLTDYLGGATIAGGKMKATGTIEEETGLWDYPNAGATNESGFTALPGGWCYGNVFHNLGGFAHLWSSTENTTGLGWCRDLYASITNVNRGYGNWSYSYSVRCIKDTPPTWSCGDILNDTRDNQTYNTVQIGTQCWMAENLNIGTRISGIAEQADNNIIEKYCNNDIETNCDTYGGLYQWDEVMQYVTTEGAQGICPTGWHIPTTAEWTIIENYLGGENIAGGKMKTTGTIEAGTGLWYAPNTGATNESGFTGLPGTHRNPGGSFYNLGGYASMWSSTYSGPIGPWYRALYYDQANLFLHSNDQTYGFSVRCIKDTPPTWSCGDVLNDTRDNQNYNTVQIGDQCWMAENLNIGNRIDGIGDQTDNAILEKYCYDDLETNCDTYGGLYQWDEMMQYGTTEGVQGICPIGWHVPTDGEWTTLTSFLGGEGVAGGKMKTTGTIEAGTGLWFDPNTGATNSTGFTALPGGFRYEGSFYFKGNYGNFFSSSEVNTENSWYRGIVYDGTIVYRDGAPKNNGFNVRCIKDTPATWSCGDVLNDTRDNQNYNTVQIGDQCWMAENLNVGSMINELINQTQQTPDVIEKYCYDNNTANCDTYGGLYQWNEMMQYVSIEGTQGICPEGWHIPTDGEWCTMANFIDPTVSCSFWSENGTDIGIKLKSTSGWNNGGNGTNTSGFTALPSGWSWQWNGSMDLNYYGYFWTSTVYSTYLVLWELGFNYNGINHYYMGIEDGIANSVRCLKD